MESTEIKPMQRKIRAFYSPEDRDGCDDGFWGAKSQAACRAYLRSLMPKQNPWPKSDQASLRAFYGSPGDESNLVTIEFPYPMFYDGKRVTKTRVHKKCADSLLRALTSIRDLIPTHPHIKDEVEDYGGVFNFRLKRGGSSYSMHAYGAAIDLDADDNTFRDSWPMKADMPLEVMEAFAREGWIAAGAFWGYDAMHFQASQ
jgi:hypothetical protein